MTETAGLDIGSDLKRFMRKHWRTVATFAVAAILAVGSAVYVFLWFVGDAQSIGLVPRTLGLWTIEKMVKFILNSILCDLILYEQSVVEDYLIVLLMI